MPSSINSRRAESESGLQRVRNCSARRLAAVLSSADEPAFFVFIGQTVARAAGNAPFQFHAIALRVDAENRAKPGEYPRQSMASRLVADSGLAKEPSTTPPARIEPGSARELVSMAEDFDAPGADLFWLGTEA